MATVLVDAACVAAADGRDLDYRWDEAQMTASHDTHRPPVPALFNVPQSERAPLEITFRHEAIDMAVVDRDVWSPEVAASWKTTGLYLLFGPASDDASGRYSAYVGKAAPGTVADRIRDHVKAKQGWDRALLVTRSGAHGFTSTDVGWLEGAVHRALVTSSYAELLNANTPGDDTLAEWDRQSLEKVVLLIRSVMRVLGFRTDESSTPTQATGNHPIVSGFSIDRAHRVISLVEPGEWTTYGDVAEVLDSHPNGIGSHIRNCQLADGAPEWRVLNRRGESSPGFLWTWMDRDGSQLDVLAEEGVPIIDGDRADPERRVDADQLRKRELQTHGSV